MNEKEIILSQCIGEIVGNILVLTEQYEISWDDPSIRYLLAGVSELRKELGV